MPKTRKEIRRGVRDNYLAGRARKSYRHGPTLNSSFEEQPSPSETASARRALSSTGCCAKCRPILSRYSEIFKGLTHRGSELKKRKRLNPDPKRPDTTHYRDLNRQNEWIRENTVIYLSFPVLCSYHIVLTHQYMHLFF